MLNKLPFLLVGVVVAIIAGALIPKLWEHDTSDIPPTPTVVSVPYKWIDPDNMNIIYMTPNGNAITVIPGYITVPEIYAQSIIKRYLDIHDGKLPPPQYLPEDWEGFVVPPRNPRDGEN